MTRLSQKQIEVLYAESLSEKMGYNWKVEIPPDERNWPDLLIHTSRGSFGLEVCGLYIDDNRKGSSARRGESFRQKLLKELTVNYYSKTDIPIFLKIKGPFAKETTSAILDYLLVTDFQEWKTVEHDLTIHGDKTTKLFIERLPRSFANYNRWIYMDDRIGWVKRIRDDDIENIARDKSLNLHKYKKNINKVSLLIVSNRINNSGRLLLDKHRKINTYAFNKVFYYMHPLEAVVYKND